jgi:predicted Na+-dependent transporter
VRAERDHDIGGRQTDLVVVVTPRHADDRPFGAVRAIVGIFTCVLTLVVNFVVFAGAVVISSTSSGVVTATVLIVGGELVLAAAFGIAFARRRYSRAANIALAICVGIQCGAAPWLLWMLFAAAFAT